MKSRIPNKFEEKKSIIKERLKLKLEYSKKIKNKENNKILKKLNNIKNKELPKIKVLNIHNSTDNDSFNYNIMNNSKSNYMIYNKIKKNENNSNIKYNTKQSPENLNLISFNENINNIYKKVTINDFNNKEIDQKMFYNMMQNLDNFLEQNTVNNVVDIGEQNLDDKNLLKQTNNSHNNEKFLLNLLSSNKEEFHLPEKGNKKEKNDGNRFNFLRSKTLYNNHKYSKSINKKYHTNKSSIKKIDINCDNDNILDILKTEQNKKILYDDDISYINKGNNALKKSFDIEIKKKNISLEKRHDNFRKDNSEDESSDVTIISFCSEDIKDISSDFSNL